MASEPSTDRTDTTRDSMTAGALFVLNQPFVEAIGHERVDEYVALVVAMAGQAVGRSANEFTKELSAQLDAHSFPTSHIEAERMAEQLIAADGRDISITLGDGRVLHGPHPGIVEADPDVRGTEDPEADDRPVFS